MIQLPNNYIPYDSSHIPICGYRGEIHFSKGFITSSSDNNYSKTKKNRFLSLLGRGDIQKGEVLFQKLSEEFLKEYLSMCDTLSAIPRGYKTLGSYLGETDTFVRGVKYELLKHGIVSYLKFRKVHYILKAYKNLIRLKETPHAYLPVFQRMLLDETFVKKYFWVKQMTKEDIAYELIVPVGWVSKEIKRLNMNKKDNHIKRKGRKGWKASREYGLARKNQPHSLPVVQICPKTFSVLRKYDSINSVKSDGWNPSNVRRAINTAGFHDCFLWAYSDDIEGLISRAKSKSNFTKKLAILEKGTISHDEVRELYINQGMTAEEVAMKLNCHPTTITVVARRIGLSKRKPVSTETLRNLYLKEKLSSEEIGFKTGHSASTIQTYLSKRGIRKNEKRN